MDGGEADEEGEVATETENGGSTLLKREISCDVDATGWSFLETRRRRATAGLRMTVGGSIR